MLNKSEMDETDAEAGKTGNAMSPRQVRILKISIAIMSVLLVVGFILLLVGIYRQTSLKPKEAARIGLQRQLDAPVPLVRLPLKPGAQLTQVLADQGRLILHLHEANSDELIVIDLASGWQQQRITLSPQQ